MHLKEVSLSIYSFGYSAGFIDDKRPESAAPTICIENIAELALRNSLGGIEFPVDRYFPIGEINKAETCISDLQKQDLRVVIDIENFDPEYIRQLLPILSSKGLRFARIKMSNFYGGNRYKQPEFKKWFGEFIEQLLGLLPELQSHNVMLLIENHQDLGADDLIQIIGATSADYIGITWDMGNSLSISDTPKTFLKKSIGFIGNVHLKDYRLYRSQEGYYLSRCALGEGVVQFGPLLKRLVRYRKSFPMAIELGSHKSRHSDIYKAAYWEAYDTFTVAEKIDFFSFLNQNTLDGDNWMTPWERNLTGQEIIASEMNEFEQSISFLKKLKI